MATVRSRSESEDGSAGDVVGHIGPAPLEQTPSTRRLPMHRAWAVGAGAGSEDDDAYDALTDLFLGEVGAGRGNAVPPVAVPPRAPDARPSEVASNEPNAPMRGIEFLVLGHLPVLSSAWASQYARSVADEEGAPVAFVQIRGGHVTVEVAGPNGAAPGAPGLSGDDGLDVESAIRRAAGATGRWIVRADETDEPSLAHRPSVRWLTLLTSADEAAVVGAYRAIKQLVPGENDGAESGSASPGDEGGGAAVRVAVMGAQDEAADAAYAKIALAVRTFLSRPLRRAVGAPQIKSSRWARPIFAGRVVGGAEHVVRLIEEALASPPAVAPAPPPPVTSGSAVRVRESPTAAAAGTLALRVPGLTPVEIRCPYAGGVEFAVESGGRLHLLARRPEASAAGTGAIGVEPLMVAAAWAAAHAGLIGRCLGTPGSGASAVSHLFVDEPKAVRGLLDTEVRIHLLSSVEVAGQTAWVCRELN